MEVREGEGEGEGERQGEKGKQSAAAYHGDHEKSSDHEKRVNDEGADVLRLLGCIIAESDKMEKIEDKEDHEEDNEEHLDGEDGPGETTLSGALGGA